MQTDDLPQTSPRPSRPPFAKLSLFVLSISVILFALSAWLWFHGGAQDAFRRGYSPLTTEWQGKGAWIAHPIVGKTLRCDVDATDTNELGKPFSYKAVKVGPTEGCFRDDGIDGEIFAVAVGDSFTFGHKVALENVWTELLEKELGTDVVNMGLSGGAPSQALRNVETFGLPLKPKVVIFTTFVNDWLDEACFQAWWSQRQILGGQVDYPRSDAIYDAVRENAYRLPEVWLQPALGGSVTCEIDGETYQFDASAYAAQDTRSPTIAEGQRDSEKAIVLLRDKCVEIGAKLIVVIIPAKEFVYHARVSRILSYAAVQPANTFCSETADWCRKNGITCLDMLPILTKRVADGARPYFPRDGHFREEGNAILAQELGVVLKNAELLPRK